ncbi:hypothetical protein [Paenibacillus sp. RC67]|nr:hypothetical protein [Paenibacillus sp. RC67]
MIKTLIIDVHVLVPTRAPYNCGYKTTIVLVDFIDHNSEKIGVKKGTLTP